MHDGESVLDAAKRELAEELGVAVQSVGDVCLSVPDPGSSFVIDFVPAKILGMPKMLEHQELAWVGLQELPGLELAPCDRVFASHLLETRGDP